MLFDYFRLMVAKAKNKVATKPKPAVEEEVGLRVRLQILAGFLVPLLAIAYFLYSRGFFVGPG